jgi:hypothetical protein
MYVPMSLMRGLVVRPPALASKNVGKRKDVLQCCTESHKKSVQILLPKKRSVPRVLSPSVSALVALVAQSALVIKDS